MKELKRYLLEQELKDMEIKIKKATLELQDMMIENMPVLLLSPKESKLND